MPEGFMRLLTMVHISDLHLGRMGKAGFDARAPRLWAKWKHFDGLLGHSYLSLVRLEQLFHRLREEENAVLVVTGDLTTVGNADEYATARDYLGSVLKPPKGNFLGLKNSKWKELSIPGNHDHWPGAPVIIGPINADLSKTFGTLPQQAIMNLANGIQLRFLRIDSDADVSPYGASRVLARGSFKSQLQSLAASLPLPGPREIRVLLLHHSYSATGTILAINSSSKAALHDFILEHDISALLCGHVHQPPLVKVRKVTHLMQTAHFLDGRCGTTSQRSTPPYDWTTIIGERPSDDNHWPNSLLVHRLNDDGSNVSWETEIYLERSDGFQPAGQVLPVPVPKTQLTLLPRDKRAAATP
jgi:3',5'-cyclic AMP phosphodiesterase CpdA